nr:MAG TPA: hypothetical protein [Bacteriophage sp.]
MRVVTHLLYVDDCVTSTYTSLFTVTFVYFLS